MRTHTRIGAMVGVGLLAVVVMHTNVNIHISAVGRYEDDLIKRGGKWYILKRVRSE